MNEVIINRQIDHLQSKIYTLCRMNDKYAAQHGEFSPEIDAEFNRYQDELELLLAQRRAM